MHFVIFKKYVTIILPCATKGQSVFLRVQTKLVLDKIKTKLELMQMLRGGRRK